MRKILILITFAILSIQTVSAAMKAKESRLSLVETAVKCIENGYVYTQQNCDLKTGSTLKEVCPFAVGYFKTCQCPENFQYNQTNCPYPRVLRGMKCQSNYTKCDCPDVEEILLNREYCTDYCDKKCVLKKSCDSPYVPNPEYTGGKDTQILACVCPPEYKLTENAVCLQKCTMADGVEICVAGKECQAPDVPNESKTMCQPACTDTQGNCNQKCHDVEFSVFAQKSCRKDGEKDAVCALKNRCAEGEKCINGLCMGKCLKGQWSETGYMPCETCFAPMEVNITATKCYCPSSYQFGCTESNASGWGTACDGKYLKCNCAPGYYWDITKCEACPNGTACAGGEKKLEMCEAPKISNPNRTECVCPESKACKLCAQYYNGDCSAVCKSCCNAEYKFSCIGMEYAERQSADVCGRHYKNCKCRRGYYWDGAKCTICPEGHLCLDGFNKAACPVSQIVNSERNRCICPEGKNCQLCAEYYKGDCAGICQKCCDKTYKFECRGEGYADQEKSSCGGYYDKCACAAGYAWNGNSCEKCESKYWCSGGFTDKVLCPVPQVARADNLGCTCPSNDNCKACKEYYTGECNKSCKLCCSQDYKYTCVGEGISMPVGVACSGLYQRCECEPEYMWNEEKGICEPGLCEPGTFSKTGRYPCQQCNPNTYADKEGSKRCQECSNDEFSGVGSSKCYTCDDGFSKSGNGFTHPLHPLCRFCNTYKGFILFSDKTFSREAEPGKTPIGVIVDSCKRYAVALDWESVLQWASDNSCDSGVSSLSDESDVLFNPDKENGRLNTLKAVQSATRYCKFPAAQYCYKYKTAGTRQSEWYVPTIYQLNKLNGDAVIKKKVVEAGGKPIEDDFHWSSTEDDIGRIYINNIYREGEQNVTDRNSFYPRTRCFINY